MTLWEPKTSFDHACLDMQPEHNFIFGQLQFEEQQKKYFKPLPNQFDLLEPPEPPRWQLRLAKLELMRNIQQIAGTKPYGHQASLADWENTDDALAESAAMIRHFEKKGEPHTYPVDVPTTGIIWTRRNNRICPILLDSRFFVPGATLEELVALLDGFIAKNPPPISKETFDSYAFFASKMPPLDDSKVPQFKSNNDGTRRYRKKNKNN